jgi:hypothetical protein
MLDYLNDPASTATDGLQEEEAKEHRASGGSAAEQRGAGELKLAVILK